MDPIKIFIISFASFFAGYLYGLYAFRKMLRQMFEKIAENLGMTLDEYNDQLNKLTSSYMQNGKMTEIPTLTTEIHVNTILAYDTKTNNFVAQGSTLEELAKNCFEVQKLPQAVVFHEGSMVYFINGNIVQPST